jgi:hypothetical protein
MENFAPQTRHSYEQHFSSGEFFWQLGKKEKIIGEYVVEIPTFFVEKFIHQEIN